MSVAAPAYVDKDYATMDEAELRGSLDYWAAHCASAPGWSSAYFAATQLKHICSFAAARGIELINPYPIKYG